MITWADFTNISTILQEGSFTLAANKLYISQSAISQSVAKVEKELGLCLFTRQNNRIQPTQACLIFAEKSMQIVDLYNQLLKEMDILAKSDCTHLCIGAAPFFSRFLSYHNEFIRNTSSNPIKIDITETNAKNIESMTVRGDLEFCFTRYPLQMRSLDCEPLFTEEILLAIPASHPLCQKYPQTRRNLLPIFPLEELKEEPLGMVKSKYVTPKCIEMCRHAGFYPHMAYRTNTWEHVLDSVMSLGIIGFVSILDAVEYINNPAVCFYRIDSPLAFLKQVVAYPSKEILSPIARNYIDTFRKYISEKISLYPEHHSEQVCLEP